MKLAFGLSMGGSNELSKAVMTYAEAPVRNRGYVLAELHSGGFELRAFKPFLGIPGKHTKWVQVESRCARKIAPLLADVPGLAEALGYASAIAA